MNSKSALELCRTNVTWVCFYPLLDIIEQDLDKLEKVKKLIPLLEKHIESAKNDLYSRKVDTDYHEVKGQTLAYIDILLELKEVLENENT